MSEPGVLTHQDGPVWTVTLNRPGRRNALDLDDRRELCEALAAAENASGCRAIVLAGAGKVFCAGGDIRSMTPDGQMARQRLDLVADLARALARSATPVVAAVTGGAYGLGLALAAASDYVVAAEDARFTASFGKLGLTADTGLSWSLPRRVGPARAREMLLFANDVDAVEAHRWGLVNEVVPAAEVAERARERARTLATAAPDMIAATKRILEADRQDLDSLLAAETEAQLALLDSEEFAARRRAFLSRRSGR